MTEPKFEVGDIVEAWGVRGVVRYIDPDYDIYPIGVRFENAEEMQFKADGKLMTWHKEPSLKLISKAKKKRRVTKTIYVNIYGERVSASSSIDNAVANAATHATAVAVPFTGSYEIEEE